MEQVSSEPITIASEQQNIIIQYMIQKTFSDIESIESSQRIWNILCGFFITMKWICITIAVPLLSFSITSFQEYSKTLSYLTGCISLGGGAFDRMGLYCSNNSKHCNTKLNELRKTIGIDHPNINVSFVDTEQIVRSRQIPMDPVVIEDPK